MMKTKCNNYKFEFVKNKWYDSGGMKIKEDTTMHIGCHISIAKGFNKAAKDSVKIGANTFQFFTRNPRGGNAKALDSGVRAGVQIGHTYIFDYYHDALGTIAKEDLPAYAQRVAKPYLAVAVTHLDPRRTTHTERLVEPLLQRLRQRADMPDEGALS